MNENTIRASRELCSVLLTADFPSSSFWSQLYTFLPSLPSFALLPSLRE
jgi:hypothetical protein